MLKLQHIVPNGHPNIVPGVSGRLKKLMPSLILKVAGGWTPIPDTDHLEVFLTIKDKIPCLGFRKNKEEVYVHVFGFELSDQLKTFAIVSNLYFKFNLGIPAFPQESNWIYTIPVPGPKLSPSEVTFIHEITQSLFWTVYMDFKKHLEGLKQ